MENEKDIETKRADAVEELRAAFAELEAEFGGAPESLSIIWP